MTYNKRGQAAMEFLMTYGWAILAAIIAIGVLAYFGVFNPSRLAGAAAVLNAPMNVDSFNIVNDQLGCSGNPATPGATTADCINLQITQNGGQTINIVGATITLTSGGTGICTNRSMNTPSQTWSSGTSQLLNFSCDTTTTAAIGATTIFTTGTSVAGNIELKYIAGSGTLVQTSTGNVRGVAQ